MTAGQVRPATDQVLRAMLEAAVLAPSSHNSQPWRFEVGDGAVSLLADRTRQLQVADPDGRELVISCGAALHTLVLGAHHAGHRTAVERLPQGPTGDVLATVTLVPGDPPPADLFGAVTERRTTRGPMRPGAVAARLQDALVDAAASHDAWLHLVDAGDRTGVADLVAAGDRLQFAVRAWRAELASWMRPAAAGDGLAVSPLAAPVVRAVVGRLDLGRRTAAKDRELAWSAPVLAVLGTDDDTPAGWLHAGEALQHVLLLAARAGLQAGYLNQPCQVSALRGELRALLGRHGWPQVVLRIGRPVSGGAPTPRRTVAEVLVG